MRRCESCAHGLASIRRKRSRQPGIAVAQIGGTLEKTGLLIVTEDDEFVPGRDNGRITVQEILDVARNQRSGHSAARAAGACH
mgnify:CR=1 FL=1